MSTEVTMDEELLLQGLPRDVFFGKMAKQGLALTFDDILLDTGFSDVAEHEVDLTTRFSKNVDLKVPFVSAAMDTVTTGDMGIALSKLGGLGVIGAYLEPEEQKKELRKVKRALSGLLEDPICVTPDQSIESVLQECEKKDFGFRSFPVTENGKPTGKFLGVITQKNFTFHQHSPSTLVSEAMTLGERVISGQRGTKYDEAYRLMLENDKLTLPLLNEDGSVAGLYVWTDVNQAMHGDQSPYSVDERGRLRVGAAVSTDDADAIKRIELWRKYVDVVVVDTSKGDHKYGRKAFERLREKFDDLDLVPGNITNGKSAIRLAEMGAAGIKVGQGGGSICTTREELGYGCPQATAVFRVSKALELRGFDIPVCSDGGIAKRGDVPIALASGAHTVMMGRMLAGTNEAPGEITPPVDGQRYKLYRGMGSESAMEESAAARLRYGNQRGLILPEGIPSLVEYQGSVVEVLGLLALALRNSMTGYDVRTIPEMHTKTRFQRNTEAGRRESSPHDVKIVAFQTNKLSPSGR